MWCYMKHNSCRWLNKKLGRKSGINTNPDDASGNEPACQCRRCKRHRFDSLGSSISGLRRSPWRRAWQLTSVFLPGESHGQRGAWWTIVLGVTKSQTWLKWLSVHIEPMNNVVIVSGEQQRDSAIQLIFSMYPFSPSCFVLLEGTFLYSKFHSKRSLSFPFSFLYRSLAIRL